MKSVYLEELSWYEIKEAMEAGVDTVIIGAASHEQHGPHMAENTDYVIGKTAFGEVAKRLGNALVAPVIRPGLSPHHMGHPGSLNVRPEIFCGMVEDYVACMAKHGFKNIVLCSSHGGNFATLDRLAKELDPKYPNSKVINALLLQDFIGECVKGDQIFDLEKGACGGHACCFETSIMLYLRPDLVNMDRAVRGFVCEDTQAGADRLLAEGMMTLSPSGILGDATPSTAEMGKVLFENLCEAYTQAIRAKIAE